MIHKGCPRCRGDVYVENVRGEIELICLQCGNRRARVIGPSHGNIGRLRLSERRRRP
jgi:hypothetical protein